MTEIVVALITGGLALAGVLWSSHTAVCRMHSEVEKAQAITNTKLEELTREVREHNHFAQRMPVVEEQIKVINHRSEEHTSELQSQSVISYAVFCLNDTATTEIYTR